MKTSGLSWFAQFLNSEYDRRFPHRPHGSLKSFADICGQRETTVGRWLIDENKPKVDTAALVLSQLGGDINRALPGYKPQAKPEKDTFVVYESGSEYGTGDPRSIFISGQVSAGQVKFAGEDQYLKSVDQLWSGSRFYGLTHGDLVYLEVHGDSMAPEYTSGEIIVCRQPVNVLDLPNGTPCVFQEGEEDGFTFKLLRRALGGQIVGQPINPAFDMVVFQQEDLRIPLVVLGKVQLEKKDMVHVSTEAAEVRRKAAKKQK